MGLSQKGFKRLAAAENGLSLFSTRPSFCRILGGCEMPTKEKYENFNDGTLFFLTLCCCCYCCCCCCLLYLQLFHNNCCGVVAAFVAILTVQCLHGSSRRVVNRAKGENFHQTTMQHNSALSVLTPLSLL